MLKLTNFNEWICPYHRLIKQTISLQILLLISPEHAQSKIISDIHSF